MTYAAPDRLLQTLRIRVAGATDEMLTLELYNAVDEFLRRTMAWTEDVSVDLSKDQREYSLPIPAGAAFVRIAGVEHNNMPVTPASQTGQQQTQVGNLDPALVLEDGDALFNPALTDEAGGVFSWSLFRPGYISITATPTDEQLRYPLVVKVALSVGTKCLECESCDDWDIPDWMWDMYFQDWLDGVQMRMYSMANKPWTNAQLTQYHGKRWRNAMGLRKDEVQKGFVYNSRRPRPRFPRGFM